LPSASYRNSDVAIDDQSLSHQAEAVQGQINDLEATDSVPSCGNEPLARCSGSPVGGDPVRCRSTANPTALTVESHAFEIL
jgi:hypothetical protein